MGRRPIVGQILAVAVAAVLLAGCDPPGTPNITDMGQRAGRYYLDHPGAGADPTDAQEIQDYCVQVAYQLSHDNDLTLDQGTTLAQVCIATITGT